MDNAEKIRDYVKRLKEASKQAIDAGEYTRGVELANAARALQDWQEQGMPGEMPVDLAALLGEEAVEVLTPPQPPKVEPVPEPRLEPPYESEADRKPRDLLKAARKKALDDHYAEAEADLWTVVDQAEDTSLLQEAEEALTEVEAVRKDRLIELVREAKRAEREESGNLTRQRATWEAVQRVDPTHSGALNALLRLAARERLEKQRRRIDDLRAPLRVVRKDIAAVEKARLEAHEMLLGEEITDPDLHRQIEKIYRRLDELRDEILRASEGGASSERAKDFETAIGKYRAALRAGYDVIADDTTGEPINVVEAHERTLQAYWADLRERSSRRYNEAQSALEDGYPETTIGLLEEAQGLMRKVEEGGEEIRRQVDEALARAQEALKNKQEAQRLVSAAEAERNPHEARVKLVEAKQHYPHYPDLETMIAQKERLLLAHVAREAVADLSAARGGLARAQGKVASEEFEKARGHCRTALQRGANLSTTYKALVDQWEKAQALLEEIDRQEAKYHELLAKLSLIDEALEKEDVRLARNLMAQLTEEEQGAQETLDRRLRLAELEEDDEKYAEAERFFYREQDYERVIEVCRGLKDSVDFRERARTLRRRAEARLWLGQARETYQGGKLDGAIADYRRVEGLASDLPEGDQPLLEEAKAERRKAEQEKQLAAELRGCLRDLADLRLQEKVPWKQWLEGVRGLRKDAPVWLREDLEGEYEAGVEEWLGDACQQADRHEMRGETSRAYEMLIPLADQELLPADDPLWRRVQCSYFSVEAKRLLDGYQVEHWEQAEEMAKQALDAAPMSQAAQVQTEFLRVVHEAILKSAAQVAATTNPGPAGAVRLLEDKMVLHPLLKQDSQVRTRLIRYSLDLGDHDRALEHARTMAYVPGEEHAAPFWEGLVHSARDFAEGQRVRAVGFLVDVRRRGLVAGRVSDNFRELYESVMERALSQLRGAVVPAAPAVSDAEVIVHVQTLDLILQLDPDDEQARAELEALADRLDDLVRPLRERAEALRLRESLRQSLEEGESLLMEIQALLRALALVHRSEALASPLRRVESDVRDQVEQWRSAAQALEQLGQQWEKSVAGTWEIDALQSHLDRAQQSLTGEVTEITLQEERIRTLRASVRDLTSLLQAARTCWNEEDFERFIDNAGAVEAALGEARMLLDEEKFIIPDKRLTFFDPFTQARVVGLSALKQAAQDKQHNFHEWKSWQSEFEGMSAKVLNQWQQVEAWVTARPPCLSRPVDLLGQIEQDLRTLGEKVEAQPQKVLSGKAKPIADRFAKDALVGSLQERQQQARERLKWAEAELARVEEPLERMRKFARRRQRLSHPRNRRTLRLLLDEAKAIDSCHPEVEGYEEVLQRFED